MKTTIVKTNVLLPLTLLCAVLFSCGDSSDDDNNPATTDAITKAKITGFSQKGPFQRGSNVTLQELDGKTLAQTGRSFKGSIESDKGDFSISSLSLVSQYAFLEAHGFYRNEVSGERSVAQITLSALTDLSDRNNVNINLLTHLEYRRVLHLIENERITLKEAKTKAGSEIFKVFGIEGNFASSEDLSIFSNTEGDAALLAISVLLQGNRTDAELSELLMDFSMDIEKDGTYDNTQIKTDIADWARNADLQSIRNNILGWGISESVPAFEKYVYNYWVNHYGLGECENGDFGEATLNYYYCNASNTWQKIICDDPTGQKVNYDSRWLTCNADGKITGSITDDRDGQAYKVVQIGSQVWMAENLNYRGIGNDTVGICYNNSADSCAKYGRLYTWAATMAIDSTYNNTSWLGSDMSHRGVCPIGWRVPNDADWDNLTTAVGSIYSDQGDWGYWIDAGTKLKSAFGWSSYNGTDNYGFSALPGGRIDSSGFNGVGDNSRWWSTMQGGSTLAWGRYMGWHDGDVHEGTGLKDEWWSVRCVRDD